MAELLIAACHIRPQQLIKSAKWSIAATMHCHRKQIQQILFTDSGELSAGGVLLLAATRYIYDLRCLV